MKPFAHKNANTVEEASLSLRNGDATLIAGGTDLLAVLKDTILPDYPRTVVNLKTVTDLEYIKEDRDGLSIGALTRLADIAASPLVRERYTALALAAERIASPHIRGMATIGGNLAQLPRCWYFRKPENRFPCIRKGGTECYALTGDSRFHSAFGGVKTCVTPCTAECPAGTDIPGYLALVREGDLDGAARLIMQVNPMPAITGRVCAHFCQKGCNRHRESESVQSGSVERALGDYILRDSGKFYPNPDKNENASALGTEVSVAGSIKDSPVACTEDSVMNVVFENPSVVADERKGAAGADAGDVSADVCGRKSVAVVGSGPAGLSTAYFLRLAGVNVTVFEAKEEPGGMLLYAVPAFRLPKDVVRTFIRALEGMGIEFRTNVRIGVDIKPEDLERYFDAVCYTTGAWKRPVLGLSGEEMTVFGLDFLVEVSKWMNGKVGAEVIVAGGGNVAMDVAITAKRLGAKKVTLACLEPRDRMPATEEEIARAEEEGIILLPSWGLSKVVEKDGRVAGLELKRCVSPWDESGAFAPHYDERETTVIAAENILMAVGQQADLSFLDEKYQLKLTAGGLIEVAGDTAMTSRKGVFAGGDVASGPATVIRSVTGGRNAADGILLYLGVYPAVGLPADTRPAFKVSTPPAEDGRLSFDAEGKALKKAMKLKEADVSARRLDIEDSASPTLEGAAEEALRCLNCGCYAVNPSDSATALVALDAVVVTNKRAIPTGEFFAARIPGSTVLEPGEVITEIRIPAPTADQRSTFTKMAFRKSIDFSVVSCAVVLGGKSPRVCLGAVAPVPFRAVKAEEIIASGPLDEKLAEAAGEAAIEDAIPFEDTRYKLQIAKTLVKRTLLAMR